MSRRSRGGEEPPKDRMRPAFLLAFVTLWICTPLLPSDTAGVRGPVPLFAMFWSVLSLAWVLWAASRKISWRWGATTVAVLGFTAWQVIAALATAHDGQPRTTYNAMWIWLTFAMVFFLGQQLIHSTHEQRAMVSVSLALATCLVTLGFYQYFISMPETRREYEANPELALNNAGVFAPAGSPEREMFESRLYSTEPLATFSLTNSFAGFLVPWLLVAVASVWPRDRTESRWPLVVRLVFLSAIVGCFLLTKSRTAWLATLCGLALLLLFGRRSGWRPDWRLVAGGVAAIAVLGMAATLAGGLDWLVIAESSKAIRFRLEYWQATWELIKDYPLFGVGPGNFQQYYTAYKLPQSSETIADPHNFVFEIWAASGTVGILAFLGVCATFVWQVTRPRQLSPPADVPASSDGGARPVYWGALAGILLAYPLGAMVGYQPEMVVLAFGVPIGALSLFAWHPWVATGNLSTSAVFVAGAALLVNFLAAGGIMFPGVANSWWLLLVLGLAASGATRELTGSSPIRWVGAATATCLALAAYFTAYAPMLYAEEKLAEGRLFARQGRTAAAAEAFEEAALRDPASAEPWEELANLHYRSWLAIRRDTDFQEFEAAATRLQALHPRSSRVRMQIGHWWLTVFRVSNDLEHLETAVRHYRGAVTLYPNHSYFRAQLAWALHLLNDQDTDVEAEMALQLDVANTHAEQDLSRRKLYDPGPLQVGGEPEGPGTLDAEQWMQQLRSKRGNAT